MSSTLPLVRFLSVLSLASVAALGCTQPKEPSAVVLITLDTLRADHLGVYGYYRSTSPNLDRFAEESVLFERAIAPTGTSLPSHVSLMTSTLTVRHGVKTNYDVLAEEGLWTLAEIFRNRGWQTAAFVSSAVMKSHTGIDKGFDLYDEPEGDQRRADAVTDAALEWLRAQPERPFFLWLHYFDPHAPYDAPGPFDGSFGAGDGLKELLVRRGVEVGEGKKVQGFRGQWIGSLEEIARHVDDYDEEIRFLDQELGRLFTGLDERGLWDGSTVVVTSDHGEGLGQHARMEHATIFHEQLWIPLMIKLPSSRDSGHRVKAPVGLVDIPPTLLTLCGIELANEEAAQFQGVNILQPELGQRQIFSERENRETPEWESGERWALTGRRWKYFHVKGPAGERDELYDLSSDPHELEDLATGRPRLTRYFRAQLGTILTQEEAVPGERSDLPEEVIKELRSLGYLEPD